jgi:hypothetical protein
MKYGGVLFLFCCLALCVGSFGSINTRFVTDSRDAVVPGVPVTALDADAFNAFNHPNFASPDNIVGDPSEGRVFSTSIDNRRMQFSLRYSF